MISYFDQKEIARSHNAPFKWLESIGDPDIAIALLLKLVDQLALNFNFPEQLEFSVLKDTMIYHLKDFKIGKSYILSKNVFDDRLTFIHWFDIKGLNLCFESSNSLGLEIHDSLERYCLDFTSNIQHEDVELLFKLSGWRTYGEVFAGLKYLNKRIIGRFQPTNNHLKFKPCHYNVPISDDFLFFIEEVRNYEYVMMNMKVILNKISNYQENGCPMGLSCRDMVGDKKLCENYNSCKHINNW